MNEVRLQELVRLGIAGWMPGVPGTEKWTLERVSEVDDYAHLSLAADFARNVILVSVADTERLLLDAIGYMLETDEFSELLAANYATILTTAPVVEHYYIREDGSDVWVALFDDILVLCDADCQAFHFMFGVAA